MTEWLYINIQVIWIWDLFIRYWLCISMSHVVKYHHLVNLYLSECCKSLISSKLYSYWHWHLKNEFVPLILKLSWFKNTPKTSPHIFWGTLYSTHVSWTGAGTELCNKISILHESLNIIAQAHPHLQLCWDS